MNMPKTRTSGKPPQPDRVDPGSERHVPLPGTFQGKLPPNFYCRAWNGKRFKYCEMRAGQGTDHPGTGRCRLHGGESLNVTRYSQVQHPRLRELIANFDQDPDPLDLLPELALLRALVVDYLNRYEEITTALVAWHYSFSEEYRRTKTQAFERWLKTDQKLPFSPPTPIPDKPRKVLDLTGIDSLLQKIGGMVGEIERIQQADALPRHELVLLMQEMGRVVEQANIIEDPITRLRTIRSEWLSIRLRLDAVQPAQLTA